MSPFLPPLFFPNNHKEPQQISHKILNFAIVIFVRQVITYQKYGMMINL